MIQSRLESNQDGELTRLIPRLRARMRRWEKVWGVAGIADDVEISFSRRMSRAAANCRPRRSQIRLNLRFVQPEVRELLPAVLCHEFAHIVAFRLYGSSCRPHGREWRELYSRAGFDPDRTLSLPLDTALQRSSSRSVFRYEHRCPICQNVYLARRSMLHWRCGNCLDAGLDGRLIITARRR